MTVRFLGNSPVQVTLEDGPRDVQPGEPFECSDHDWEHLHATGLFERVGSTAPNKKEG